ncbi:FAD-dependent oxidoreductase [Paenibacillus rhizovicinus]|uniref:FAD-dependent oxidoreductase n=1 Tax=Paenibacillus rhizovicinus TaxID=2704463 RepID=A0A6C0NXZ5_9BACL|nr:FAD-dependent oxidoreductase [Paenibacillus rhizovicinus]QHW31115.1 FAD-dependent oxidoreductase [Paenibacillus rhizovicinus]
MKSDPYYEIVVYGATPGGIGAAIAAARRGRRTLLLEPSPYIGGMMTSGLGRTDIDWLEASGAIYREFAGRVEAHYAGKYGTASAEAEACNRGMFFEPSLARAILEDMLAEERFLTVVRCAELLSADVEEGRLTRILIEKEAGDWQGRRFLSAEVFIDGTYEGDLAALAGVPYEVGRESRDEWNEEFAGVLYMNFDPSKEVLPGSTGEGDDRIQAYNYRLCITDVPENRVAVSKPAAYNREEYASLAIDAAEGRIRSIRDVLNILPVPGGKTDTNNHHYCMCSSDLPEENGTYLDGSREERQRVRDRHRHYLQGLLWFLQHDESLPLAFREESLRWGYAADEFTDTEHFPPQLYVREGRRILGEYRFTENDARLAPGFGRTPIHADSVAVGAYAIDSHATRKREAAGQNAALEGFLGLGWLTEVYQIPYGVMLPLGVEGLLVPVAVSATHMGLGTIRMEPCWMQLGYAAGAAADLAIRSAASPRGISIDALQDELLAADQLIGFYRDTDASGLMGKAIQYFGAKGAFRSYEAEPDQAVTVEQASALLALARLLPGGARFPALPAAGTILPAGTDMGPRLPREEPSPAAYWQQHPLLAQGHAGRWLQAAGRALAGGAARSGAALASHPAAADWLRTDSAASAEDRPSPMGSRTGEAAAAVTVGEWCGLLYGLLLESRRQAGARAGGR